MTRIRTVEDVLDYINFTWNREDRISLYKALLPEVQDEISLYYYNNLKDSYVATFSGTDDEVEDLQELVRSRLDACRITIEHHMERYLQEGPETLCRQTFFEDVDTILKFFYDTKDEGPERTRQRARDSSEVFDANSFSKSVVAGTLKADQVHHNMFNSGPSKLEPIRFVIPADILSEASRQVVDECTERMEWVRLFLKENVVDEKKNNEPLTQAVFLYVTCRTLSRRYEAENWGVVDVTGMADMVDEAWICEDYMKRNYQEQGKIYTGGDKEVTLKIKSDLAVTHDQDIKPSNGKQKREIYLSCAFGVEMKSSGVLSSSNRSSLTQLCIESKLRGQLLGATSQRRVLLSVLTDCFFIYVLCHDREREKYWISRAPMEPQSPKRFVSLLLWVAEASLNPDDIMENVQGWAEESDTTPDDAGGATQDDEGGDGDSTRGTNRSRGTGDGNTESMPSIDDEGVTSELSDTEPRDAGFQLLNEDGSMVLAVEDDDSDEGNRDDWAFFNAVCNHRAFGTPMPICEPILSSLGNGDDYSWDVFVNVPSRVN